MIERYECFLDCNNHLRKKYSMIVEAFVSYYGEEKRIEIEEKLGKALLIGYKKPDYTKTLLSEIGKEYTKGIFEELSTKIPSTWTQEELCESFSFEHSSIMPITYFKDFYELYTLGEEGRLKRFREEGFIKIKSKLDDFTEDDYKEVIELKKIPQRYENIPTWMKNNILYYANSSNVQIEYERSFRGAKKLLEKKFTDVSLENIEQLLETEDGKSLIEYIQVLPEKIEEYNSRMQKYDSYKKEIEEQNTIQDELTHKYYVRYIEENLDLFSPKDIETIEIYKQDKNKSYVLSNFTTYILGHTIFSTSPLEAFSEESDQILEDEEESEWKKNSIIQDRIQYFQKIGFDLGEDYEAYVSNDDIKKIWPSKERVNRLIESKNRIINEYNNEYFTSIPSHRRIREEIDSLDLLDKEDGFNASIYTVFEKTFVSTNVRKIKKEYDMFSLVVINCGKTDGSLDHDIIHEFNHLYELTLRKVEGKTYEAICGWDICQGTIMNEQEKSVDTLNDSREKRSYELMNEIINELIAQEIYLKMLENNQHIFDTSENVKYKNLTSYEYARILIEDFFEEFKKEIIESRRNGKIEIIWNRVGKENFDDLNELFHIFYKHFDGFNFYNLLDSLQKNEDNEKTRIYRDLIAKRDKILDKMRKHSMLQQDFTKEEQKNVKEI